DDLEAERGVFDHRRLAWLEREHRVLERLRRLSSDPNGLLVAALSVDVGGAVLPSAHRPGFARGGVCGRGPFAPSGLRPRTRVPRDLRTRVTDDDDAHDGFLDRVHAIVQVAKHVAPERVAPLASLLEERSRGLFARFDASPLVVHAARVLAAQRVIALTRAFV